MKRAISCTRADPALNGNTNIRDGRTKRGESRMIHIENVEISGLEAAVRGMRNPMNSWEKSDSGWGIISQIDEVVEPINVPCFVIGDNDLKLMKSLAQGGGVHAKYRRMITVTCDIVAPLYWWKEYDTYKVGTVANSCSTMHKIHAKEFTMEDFSCERMSEEALACLDQVIAVLDVDSVEELGKLIVRKADIQNRTHNLDHGSCIFGHRVQLLVVKSVIKIQPRSP
jgi:hypothetical protein